MFHAPILADASFATSPSPWRHRWAGRNRLALVAVVIFALAVAVAALLPRAGDPGRAAPVQPPHLVRPPAAPPVEDQRLLAIPEDTALAINARRPVLAGGRVTAQPFIFAGTPEARARAVDCLAAAGWYEAGDDMVGERAVMQVVVNRVRHPAFPASVCAAVFQGSERSTGCQFTFTCDGSLQRRNPPAAAWARAQALAAQQLNGKVDGDVGYATHYHANYVVPYWADSLDKIAGVGAHLFYRWKGYWGTRPAFARRPMVDEPAFAALARLSPSHASALSPAAAAAAPALAGAASVPAPSLPPAVVVAGVREKSLRGAVVRGDTAANQFFLQLDAATFPGNYATAAVALCKGKPACTVMGWRDAALMSQTPAMSSAQRDALSFYFVQSAKDGDRALWNCQQTPRSNTAQCLPTTGPLPSA